MPHYAAWESSPTQQDGWPFSSLTIGELTLEAGLPSCRCTAPAPAVKLEIGVSLASPLAVMVVGKNTVAPPLVFFGEKPGPGDMINGDTGNPSLAISSIMFVPLPKGELTSVAEVGSPWEASGNAPPTIACGDGGGRVGVLGRLPGMGGPRVKGE